MKRDCFNEESELQILRKLGQVRQYGKYVMIDWDKDPDKLGETNGKSIAELIREIRNEEFDVLKASEQIIVKRYEYTIGDYFKQREPKATVAIKVMGTIKK